MRGQPASKTATDTLAKKSKSEDVISGGHLVANIVNIQLILPEVKTLNNPYLPLINSKS